MHFLYIFAQVMSYQQLWRLLAQTYGEGEAKAIARMVFEIRYGLTFSDILLGKDTQLSSEHQEDLQEIACRLQNNEPVQYVLGEAVFCGRTFRVAPGVLIPRPETEELCRWVVQEVEGQCSISDSQFSILDIGTGSGCIAITLAAELPASRVTAWDISLQALSIAQENARRQGVSVAFEEVDVLAPHLSPLTPHLYIIVSNPPYICNKERATMEANVLDYEPAQALFVPDDDPLLFYRAIAQYALLALQEGGRLFFEINPLYADDLREMLCAMRFSRVESRNDAYGKTRMIQAIR